MGIKMNKRGSILDLIFIGVTLLVFSMTVLIVFKISSSINTEFQVNDDIPDSGKNAFDSINGMNPGVINNMALILAVGLAIAAFVLASLVRVHPVFLVFYLLILVSIIFVSGIFSNIYLEMANNPSFIVEAGQLNFITKIMHVLPFFVGIFGSLLAIVMYKNWRDEQ